MPALYTRENKLIHDDVGGYSRRQMRAILNTIIDGVITMDSEGIIRSFSPSAERIFGIKAMEVTE
ncbi:MAG: PAS domain S-box protein [Rickettsiales bacterium]|nr:PAS domain S-box protein [Rickettsiales bacterium]